MYTKIVVIVNVEIIVDKSVYFIRFKNLGWVEVAVQVLYQVGTVVGQFCGCPQGERFCTTDAVDIQ
jgi:hypothetical protein